MVMAFTFLGPQRYFEVGSFANSTLSPLVMWMASLAGNSISAGEIVSATWCTNVTTASLVLSMTLNALVTSLIVYKIFVVFREFKVDTSSDKISLGVTRGGKHRYVMFVIIESGMILFLVQFARVVSTALKTNGPASHLNAFNFIVSFHVMLNVTKTTSSSLLTLLLIAWIWLGHNTYHHSDAGIDGIIFPRRDIFDRNFAIYGSNWGNGK